jgi:hypothetical protein
MPSIPPNTTELTVPKYGSVMEHASGVPSKAVPAGRLSALLVPGRDEDELLIGAALTNAGFEVAIAPVQTARRR